MSRHFLTSPTFHRCKRVTTKCSGNACTVLFSTQALFGSLHCPQRCQHNDQSGKRIKAFSESPHSTQRLKRKPSLYFPHSCVCIFSRNLLRARTFHRNFNKMTRQTLKLRHFLKAHTLHRDQTESFRPTFHSHLFAFYQGIF